MATTTTLTSLASSKSVKKELCIICESQPYDLICTCGDKFDFNCIHQHVEQIGLEFQDNYQKASEKLARIDDLRTKENGDFDAARALIDDWKRKRIQDINDIAEQATKDLDTRENIFRDIDSFQETYEQISSELHRVVHENLNTLIALNQQMQGKIEQCQQPITLINDDRDLDASLQAKLNPSVTVKHTPNSLTNNLISPPASLSSSHMHNHDPTPVEIEPIIPAVPSLPRRMETPTEITEPKVDPSMDLTNSTQNDDTTFETNHQDEFDAGKTRHIRRNRPMVIPTNNDKFAATVCCHDNQILYNDYDRTLQNFQLTFIRDINDPKNKQIIPWDERDSSININDDGWIQDIVYSEKLSSYLLLNRARLCRLNANANDLEDFHSFHGRTMKRLACSDKYIYLTSSHGSAPYNGDEIILMNYDKEEHLQKTFRDVIPSRINRGAGPLVGEISDIAVGSGEQVTIGYRLERRHEVGVCLFNVANDGREWSCVKQLLLNECWHSDLSYTPRIDWCGELDVFILIEFMTGHLIMIDREGQVEGECRFMQVENRRESPINLTISTNNWFCVRYESSISIHKISS